MISMWAVSLTNYNRTYGMITTVFSQPVFDNTKVHALASATTTAELFPSEAQTVTYTGFDKVGKVKQGNDSLCYTYGYDRQRILMEEHVGTNARTKHYVGACEYVTETNGNTTTSFWRTFISGPYGVFAVVETQNGTDEIHYVLKDNLGSWTTVTDENGTVEQRLSYDAWGNLRNPGTWSGSFTGTPMFDRGYTGHEHLYDFGLINMNGRMYDPVVSSFLSVDQYVQSPENAQGFNRYAYCMNNPLRYVDPSGWLAGGGNTGYFPNSTANAFDPYMFYGHTALEPRDLGLRQLDTSDPIITWMEENSLHGSGNGPKGGEKEGGYYVNLESGLIEHHEGQTNDDYLKQGLVFLADNEASIGDIEAILEQKGLTYEKDPRVSGGFIVDTEELYKGYLLWQSIPSMTMVLAIGSLECFLSSISFLPNLVNNSKSSLNISYEFTNTTLERMNDPSRRVPLNIIDEVIKNPRVVTPDPQGTVAKMYYSTLYKNSKLYNIEVLYNQSNNTIYHFLYSSSPRGPLPATIP